MYDSLQAIRTEMNRLTALLPEYELVMSMEGVGKVTGPQLMAEIGEVRRFSHKGALVAYAGVDALPTNRALSMQRTAMFPSGAHHT